MPVERGFRFYIAIVASLLVHAATIAHRAPRTVASAPTPLAADPWAAAGVEVGTEPALAPTTPARDSTPPSRAAPPTAATPLERPPEQTPSQRPSRAHAAFVAQDSTAALATPRAVPEHPSKAPLPPSAQARSTPDAQASSDATPASVSSVAPEARAEHAGSMGALGLPPGVRHFAQAFTRALAAGSYGDPEWSELAPGNVGRAVVEVQVDGDGHIEGLSFDPLIATPAIVKRMLDHTLLLLKAGTFSLDSVSVTPGTAHLSIDVSLTQQASPEPDAAPRELFEKGHRPPTRAQAGYARFTLNSGRHMEAVVRDLNPP